MSAETAWRKRIFHPGTSDIVLPVHDDLNPIMVSVLRMSPTFLIAAIADVNFSTDSDSFFQQPFDSFFLRVYFNIGSSCKIAKKCSSTIPQEDLIMMTANLLLVNRQRILSHRKLIGDLPGAGPQW
jgi:hypothetical protein